LRVPHLSLLLRLLEEFLEAFRCLFALFLARAFVALFSAEETALTRLGLARLGVGRRVIG
jgi:hypothetical protein